MSCKKCFEKRILSDLQRFESVFSYRKISYVMGSNWSQKVSKLESKTAKKCQKSRVSPGFIMSSVVSVTLVLIGFIREIDVRSFDCNV